MKYSNKGSAPQSFVDWQHGKITRAGVQPTFDDLQSPEKDDVRETLLQEQDFLCAYCGRRLSADFSNCHIDHFWPQSHFNGVCDEDRRLDHSNFFLSCGPSSLPGQAASLLPHTCGEAKGRWFDQRYHIMPSEPDCEARFRYDGFGGIHPTDHGDQAAQNMIKKLNLGDVSLVSDRKRLIEEVEKTILQSDTPFSEKERLIELWCTPDGAGRLPSFAQVVERYFEEERRNFDEE